VTLTGLCSHKQNKTAALMMTMIVAGDNRAPLQRTMQTQQANGNRVSCRDASDLGTLYWELLPLLTETRRQHVMTATAKH